MTAVLVCGGSLSAAFLKQMKKSIRDAVWYAVDGGLTVMDTAGEMPDYLVGDFDTADAALVTKYEKECKILRHPPEKDATDTELALDAAVENGAGFIILLGATGTRLDHTMANVHMLYHAMEKKCTAVILDEHNRITLHKSSFCIRKSDLCGHYLSFLPFFGEVKNLSISGTKYPLSHADLSAGSSLCISNEAKDEKIRVTFQSGYLLMIESRD